MGPLKTLCLADSKRSLFLQIFISIMYICFLVAKVDGYKKVNSQFVDIGHDSYPTWISTDDRNLLSQLQEGLDVHPNIVVAKDDSGQFKTVRDGINSYPKNYQGRYIIYVKSGIYDEYITVTQNKILLYGDGPSNTIITGNKSRVEGFQMPETATFATQGQDFIAKSLAFENTAGPQGMQAVALLVMGDQSSFFNCTFRGYQDTLYVARGRQFYRSCEIFGTIDFIYGNSKTLIQKSKIWVRKPLQGQDNVVVADSTSDTSATTGIVLQNCSIMPDVELTPYLLTVKTYLARPWGPFSRVVFIENYIDGFVQREGYMKWNSTSPNTENPFFAEFGNIGPGSNATGRVKWAKGLITKDEAFKFTAEPWLKAKTWLPSTGIPYDPSFNA